MIDNGSGFEVPRKGRRGLENMRGRAKAIGGAFTITHSGGRRLARLELPALPAASLIALPA
uniref:hypothetical protein n=1 Tax=Parerythrobacter lutipelagi TaxID=1964208 RepID=UPI0010F633DF|nr:hypothetical protein [Parerythrobacter lutipelagi]